MTRSKEICSAVTRKRVRCHAKAKFRAPHGALVCGRHAKQIDYQNISNIATYHKGPFANQKCEPLP